MTPKAMTIGIKHMFTTKRWIGCLKPTNFVFTCEMKSNLKTK